MPSSGAACPSVTRLMPCPGQRWHLASVFKRRLRVQRCPLIAVSKPMVTDNGVNQCRRLLMNVSVITVVRASNRRLNRVLVYDPGDPAIPQRFLMATDRILPGNAIVSSTDLPAPSRLIDASRKSP